MLNELVRPKNGPPLNWHIIALIELMECYKPSLINRSIELELVQYIFLLNRSRIVWNQSKPLRIDLTGPDRPWNKRSISYELNLNIFIYLF